MFLLNSSDFTSKRLVMQGSEEAVGKEDIEKLILLNGIGPDVPCKRSEDEI